MSSRSRTLSLSVVRPSDEAAIRDWFELRCAVARADRPDDPPPCWTSTLGRMRYSWPGEDETIWLGVEAGAVVGGCLLNLPTLDNLQTAAADIVVAPQHRGRGIGQALLAHLRAEAARHGRIRIIAEVDQPLDPAAPDPGGRFAAASGAVLALAEPRRRLDLRTADPAALVGLEAQARAKARGYSLIQWVGRTPQRWLADVAYLTGRMSLDAPLENLQWEPEAYDADRMRGRETGCLACGLHLVSTAAVADDGGPLVAFTQLVGNTTSPWYAGQWDTIVAPEHRGHRLGTLIKVANLAQASVQRPELRVIDTVNAGSNAYMIGINEAMGFRLHSRSGEWQLDL